MGERPPYSRREREMIEFLRDKEAVHHMAALEARHGWGRRTASNTLRSLYEKGVVVKVYPTAQPLYPVRLARGV